MSVTFPNETRQYRAARGKLLEAELALRKQVEQVAALRRKLPPGGELPQDYTFQSTRGPVKLSQLFERGKSEVTITPLGERIVEQAQKVLEEAARIREIAQAGGNQLVGLLKLGVIYTVGPYLLPDLIPALHARAPQMPLDIEENLTENLESALRTGQIDAAIVALPFQPPGIVTDFLYEEPFQVVVPLGHKWAKRKSIAPDELPAEHTILLNVGHCFRDQVLDACPELNRADAQVTRTNSLETVRNMVASGLGVSVLPRDALTPKYHSRLVVRVSGERANVARRVTAGAGERQFHAAKIGMRSESEPMA